MGFVQSKYLSFDPLSRLSFDPLERAYVLDYVVQCLVCVGGVVDLTVWRTNVGHKGAVLTPQESSGPISRLGGEIYTMLG